MVNTALKVADKAKDAAMILENAQDAAKALENTGDVIGETKHLDIPEELGDMTYSSGASEAFDHSQYVMKEGDKLGDFGEEVVEDMLKKDGYEEFYNVQNKSGNGVDVVAKHKNGDMLKAEVKATKQDKLWEHKDGTVRDEPLEIPMSKPQREMGGENYTNNRLDKAERKDNGYTDGVSTAEAKKAIREAEANGNKIENKKYDVYVNKEGKLRDVPKERSWEPKPPKEKKIKK